MRSRIPGVSFLAILMCVGVASWFVLPHQERQVSALMLVPATFNDLPGWPNSEVRPALAAFRRSCQVALNTDKDAVLGAYSGRAADWWPACRAGMTVSENDARKFFEDNFRPFKVGGQTLFTGYYEPLLRGSRKRHAAYQTPVYGLPRDLVGVDLGVFRPEWKGERIAGRVSSQKLLPYASRAEIDASPPPAPVLFYGDDPVSVFFLHIQGSGRVVLDDGAVRRVAYAAQNGRRYTSIGHALVRSGQIALKDASMQSIRAWLKAHPSAAREVMESDESFVFFKEAPVGDASLGSPGTQGVPLTPGASIAVDPKFHALGAPMFIDAKTGDGRPLRRLVVAQDTGGAIRGPARADIFFGFGTGAERLAGAMKSFGRLYILLPKRLASSR